MSLEERLRERIRRAGPLTFCEWMRAALYDEHEGYYRRGGIERWGRAGDYRTSPERTPLFAATFARSFARLYEMLGAPQELTILEAGAGAGQFAFVLLNTLRRDHAKIFSSLRYLIDEHGEQSRERAARLLAPFSEVVEFRRLTDISKPFKAAIIFSNELIDAFPVHRIKMCKGELREMFVALDENQQFCWIEGLPSTPLLEQYFNDSKVALEDGQTAEVNLEADKWISCAAARIESGFVVTVDYGAEADDLYAAPHRRAGTLRGFVGHRHAENILENPGLQDITTTINWTQLMRTGEAHGLKTISLEPLAGFLLREGFLEQIEREGALASGEAERAQLALGAREMILPGGMAESFQVLVQQKNLLS